MRHGFQIYDTHTHIGRARHSGAEFSADQMLRSMDSFCVDRSVLIPYPVVEDYRREHDLIGKAVADHPNRFTGAICLNPFVPEAEFRGEVARCVEKLGLRALKLQPQYQALNPLSARSDFFFETAVEHGLPIIAHTGSGVPFALPSLFIAPAQKFPELTIVLGHAGGPTYMLEAAVAAMTCPNVYVELSSLMPHHVMGLLEHVPATRLMAGSDLPSSVSIELGKIFELPIDDAARRAILWETAVGVFGGP